ncbi:MAG TPA: hypothetical protein DCM54_05475 [Gammaproteobacteria bacterium]|nr:hypothetical protein [Gammaproteobacteria bacterium]
MAEMKETMSAFVDGEASEIEVHRMLRELSGESGDTEQGLKKTLLSFLQIRSVVSKDTTAAQMSIAQHGVLFQRISDAVDDEENFGDQPAPIAWQKPAIGFAIAASLVVAIGAAVNNLDNAEPARITGTEVTAPVTTVANRATEPELRELTPERQQQLREYLNEHDRMGRMKRTTQLVNNKK